MAWMWRRGWASLLLGCGVLIGQGAAGCGGAQEKPQKIEPLRRVSVSTPGDWAGLGSLPGTKGFGDLPVDPVPGATTKPSDAAEEAVETPMLTVVSSLTLMGLPSRGLDSGQVFLPPQYLKQGEVKTHLLGDRTDGCEVQYQVGEIKDGKVPVAVEIRMWGRRQTRQKWVTRLGREGGESFQSTTRGGEQFRFSVLVEGIPAELANPELPSALEQYRRSREGQ